MQALDPAGLLQAWEEASSRPLPDRALRLVAAVADAPDDSTGPAHWSVRRRDAALFDLRHRLFGAAAEGVVACPSCGDTLEMRFDLATLRPETTAGDAEGHVHVRDLSIAWRLPTTADLVAVADEPDEARARTLLLTRCVTAVTRGDARLPVASLDAEACEQVALALSRAHADLAPTFVLDCPACGARGEVPFAIDAFVWREVDAWARRTLWEVHTLARAYGWTEPAVLALSASRRRLYLELLGHA